MERQLAIASLARVDLENLGAAERAEQLDIMLLEDWQSHPRWHSIRRVVRREFKRGELAFSPHDSRYDDVLLLWLTGRYAAATNDYLLSRLHESGFDAEVVTGEPVRLEACPCCGYRTIGARGEYNICRVCWWEDDGQDNDDADSVLGGPNGDVSLTQGRLNFLRDGIYDPKREDLRQYQVPPKMYARGRLFVVSNDGEVNEVGDAS